MSEPKSNFDRSKFRATQASTLKQADKDTEAVVKNRDASAGFIDIKKDGSHKLRIYPFHPEGGGEAFAETKVVNWLKVEVPERDKEGNIINDPKTGKAKMKIGSKPVFNSKIHGGTEKDIVEEYIKFAEKIAKDNYPGNEKAQKEFLEPIYGGYGSKYDGIIPRQTWIMYVDRMTTDVKGKITSKEFGRVEIGKAVKQRLNAISASEGSNEPLGTDPFTDLETGRAVIITYDSKAKRSQDYYTTELDASFDKTTSKVNFYPLSDDDLDKFMKYPSLASMYKDVYKLRDFNLAIEGLKNFDDEYKTGVFGYEEFLNIAEEISSYYPTEDEKKDEEHEEVEQEEKVVSKKPTVVEKEVEGDAFDEMDREELKEYCRDNRTGIIVTNKTDDDVIRMKLREWFKLTQTLEEPKAQENKDNEEDDGLPWKKDGSDKEPKAEVKENGKSTSSDDAKKRVDAIRAKLLKKKPA